MLRGFIIFSAAMICFVTVYAQTGESQYKKVNAVKSEKAVVMQRTEPIKPLITSDVDINIPEKAAKNSNKFAIIIGNEDYSSFQTNLNQEVNVDFAGHDATIFKDYAVKALGIPEENIIFKINAKSIEMNKMVEKIALIAKSSQGEAEIYFYYAGHGFPDIQTRESFLIPVDCSGDDLNYAVKLSNLYKKLSESNSKRVVVFLDACFSGGARNLGLLAARGVRVKPKEDVFINNIVVFSATSEDQPALSWMEKGHGMFTYFLLKKIQETNADVSYGDLSDYLSKNVGIKSALINEREQSPKTNVGALIQDRWKEIKLK